MSRGLSQGTGARGIIGGWRTFPAIAVGVLATAVTCTAVLALPWLWRDSRHTRHLLRTWARIVLRGAGVTVRVEGNLPSLPAAVVVGNHQSNLDAIVHLASLDVPLRFLVKRELFAVPLLGATLRSLGMVPVDRSRPDRGAISTGAARILRQPGWLMVYPEGTTSTGQTLLPFKQGAFAIAVSCNVPVVPVTVAGTAAVWPPGQWTIRPGVVRVRIGEPVSMTDMASGAAGHMLDTTRRLILADFHALSTEAGQ